MKLSEIKGDRVFDVIADIIEPVADIASDEEAMALFDNSGRPKDMEPFQYFVERAKKAIPVLVRKYRSQLCDVMASLNGVTREEYVNGRRNPDYDPDGDPDGDQPEWEFPPLTVPKLLADVLDLVTDSEFVAFFS